MEKIKPSLTGVDSVTRLFITISCCIFVSEMLIMLSLPVLPSLSVLGTALFDATLLLILIFPVLYLTLFRPLTDRLTERQLAQTEIDSAKQRLEIALEGSQISVWETDLRTNEIWLDAGWAVFLGKPRAETHTTAAELLKIVHPDDRQSITAAAVQAMKGEILSYAVEHRVKSENGDWKWILSRGQVVEHDSGGRPVRVCGTNTNITEAKQAEKALRESEARFRILTDLSSDWYWEQDRELRLSFHSIRFAQRSGTTSDKLLGKRRWEDPSRVPLSGTWDEHRATLEAHQPFRDFEYVRIGDGGERYFISLSGVPIYDDAGQFSGYRGVGTNITARKQAEQALRAAEEQFRGLVEQSIAGTYIIQDRKFTYANPRLAEIFGYGSADELIGRDPLSVIAESDRDRVAEQTRQWVKGEEASISYDFRGVRMDGSLFDVGVHNARASYRGRPAVIGLAQDISEKKRAEEQIQHYVAQIENAFMSTVQVATTLCEMRDPYTAGHQRRVAEIAVAIGAELGFDARRQEGLRVAGYLHDIGQISIPAEILSKPGKLNVFELRLVKGHAQASFEVLKGVNFPWPVAQVALQHHERLDGSGYPQGLKGDAILLEARIMAVADVIEAMSSHRPYRAELGIGEALAEIERGRGTVYDADAADACLRLFRERRYQLAVSSS